jgi:hypothetical protein
MAMAHALKNPKSFGTFSRSVGTERVTAVLPLQKTAGKTDTKVKTIASTSVSAEEGDSVFSHPIYRTQDAYDQAVALFVAKVRSGEIQPRQPDKE